MNQHSNNTPGADASGDRPVLTRNQAIRGLKYLLIFIVFVLWPAFTITIYSLPHARDSERHGQCVNLFRQVSWALETYRIVHGAYPPAYSVDETGKPLHSWRTLILPYLGHHDLYKRIDLKKPWDASVNADVFETHVDSFCCPTLRRSDDEGNLTTFMAVVCPGSCLQPGKRRDPAEITNGPKFTLTVIEVDAAHAVPWMSPFDANETVVLGLAKSQLPHGKQISALFADGTLRPLDAATSAEQWRAMISIAGDDVVTADWAFEP